jgi:hypothetical protein
VAVRTGIAIVAAAATMWTAPAPLAVRAQPSPAGATAAVLSFIDAAAGRVEVVRHWPSAPADADVYPFVPVFWDGCPGSGAIMILLAAPPLPPGGTGSIPGPERLRDLSARLAAAAPTTAGALDELRRLASELRTPGDPIVETMKAYLPLIADLGTYERRGYAVFAFITWQGWRCGVTVRAVPEGYGIPFVQ